MKRRAVLIALMLAGGTLAFGAQAGPRDRDERGHGRGKGRDHPHRHGRPGRERSDDWRWSGRHDRGRHDRDHDERGRHYGYFDDRRDRRGRPHGDVYADLVYAGITAALARQYARDVGLGGYASLPPGVRRNLARGRRLPPGIARRRVPGPFLGRLPRYPGYEWRISGTDLILISVASAVVADVLYDVFD